MTFSLEVPVIRCVLWEPRQTCAAAGQEYWSGLPFRFPGDLPDPGIEPGCPALQADSLPSEPPREIVHNILQRDLFFINYAEIGAKQVQDKL